MTWKQIDTPVAILLTILLPLAWGLGVEYVFDLLRRRRNSRKESEIPGA